MEHLSILLTVAVVHLLAVMSPGPDFLMITRNSLVYSRKTGIYSAVGLGLGILVHVIYSLIGIGYIISESIILFTLIKFLGAAYLIYIGYKSLTTKATEAEAIKDKRQEDLTPWQAVKMGFLTNVLNPKATLFFLSLFTLVINQNTSFAVKLIMGLEMSIATFLWFAFVAVLMSHSLIKSRIRTIQLYAERGIGVVLIALGIKVALSTSR